MKDYDKTIKSLNKAKDIILGLELDKEDYHNKIQSYNALSYINLAIMDIKEWANDQDAEMASMIKEYNDKL